jgi:hypothetical protein
MASQNTITGGGYQDAKGNPLALGYLRLELTADAQIPAIGQLCSGTVVKVSLDANGNVSGTVNVWPNDVLNPATTQYRIFAYTATGQLVFQRTQQILSSPSPFNLN